MKAIVIGAGIGGLAAAAALKSRGWTVRVHERAPSLEPVGSGLAMAPNALRALDTFGAGDAIRRLGAFSGDGGIRRPDGSWLSRTSAEAAERRFGDPTVVLLRSALVDVLRDRLDPDELRLGSPAESVSPDDGRVVFADGEDTADLVVAADGIGSRVRSLLFPGHPGPRYTGLTAWRLLVDGTTGGRLHETWGRGLVFGVTPLDGGRTYCYATAPAPEGATAASEKEELRGLFGGWHDPIPDLLARADPARILRNDVYELPRPLPAFHRGRVVLLGDAAHAMTPNLGQGACQAIEDAVTLAHEMTGGGGPPGYTRARLDRTARIMRASGAIARATRLRNPALVAVRDAALRGAGLLGPNIVLRQAAVALDWRPPGLTRPPENELSGPGAPP